MPYEFTYWHASDGVEHNIPDGTQLSAEEAKVIAMLQLTRAAEEINRRLGELVQCLQTDQLGGSTSEPDPPLT